MSDTLRLGFIGFGAMPRRMAARLRDAAYPMIAFDVAHGGGKIDGFAMVESAASLAGRVGAILVAVPDDAALRQAMVAPGGALDGAREGQVVINFSTVSPGASKALAEAASAKGIGYVEAPMSGSKHEAESGQLVFLAGGSDDDVTAATPILDLIGRRTFHLGAIGDGEVFKLIINGVMALAELDRDLLIDVLSGLVLLSEHHKHKHKLAMARADSYPAEFPAKLMSKDMGLLLDDTRERGVSMPSMAAAAQMYAQAGRVRPNDDYPACRERRILWNRTATPVGLVAGPVARGRSFRRDPVTGGHRMRTGLTAFAAPPQLNPRSRPLGRMSKRMHRR